ncbi:fimbria/pilus outer membrane usher protein [Providencia rettgeri]|uniref:fimbria/pilus outer membrane usher protein n=1 Tax=Providencia rettgeri TaxID=587 RepID=UPI0020584AB5|nr:fimbria/pilus outer membrane usher protein [Providencia rettgeri]UPS63405.1 fimbrial biogenesis outer membrane usher protein [Providencia rettgeri]
MRFKKNKAIFFTLSIVPILVVTSEVHAEEQSSDEIYEFNSGFIVGSQESIDLTHFNENELREGLYSIDFYVNGYWKGRHEIQLSKRDKQNIAACYSNTLLMSLSINTTALNPTLSRSEQPCGFLKEWNNDSNIKETFDPTSLRLDLTLPQLYIIQSQAGYVPPEFWDKGIPALNTAYQANFYSNNLSDSSIERYSTMYLGINSGFSYNGWQLKHIGNAAWQEGDSFRWDSNQTYLQAPLVSMKSTMTMGQFYTEGNLFDSVSLRGVKIATDDSMYLDGVTNYTPEIRGIAQSNALVTVRQNNTVIYQTTVPPGPFNLQDGTPSGYGNDLEVIIKEADGSESSFFVPYSSLPQLLRPKFTRYQIATGKLDQNSYHHRPYIIQGTLQHGYNNYFTFYTGINAYDDYQAYMLGTAINTQVGALAYDITSARMKTQNHRENGFKHQLTLNKLFSDTKTNFIVSGNVRSNESYYNLNESLYLIDNEKRQTTSQLRHEKKSLNYTINQELPESYGGFYFTGRIVDYWDDRDTEKQYQFNYYNHFDKLSYSISFIRLYSDNYNNSKDDRISINLSYPLYFGDNQHISLTSNTIFNNSSFDATQLGINGSLDEDNNWVYGINSSFSNNSNNNIALNTAYRTPYSALNASYSHGKRYRQYALGANGSMVFHADGVTFSPNISQTMALIEAKDAQGASIVGSPGTHIDSQGYALASYMRPYRVNTIELDPKGSSEDIVFQNTLKNVVPYEGSIVKVSFGTKVEKSKVFEVKRINNQPLPFGAEIKGDSGASIGSVGQGSNIFVNDEYEGKATVVWHEGECSFLLNKQIELNRNIICE